MSEPSHKKRMIRIEKIPFTGGNVARQKQAVDAVLSRAACAQPRIVRATCAEKIAEALAKAEKALDVSVTDLARLNDRRLAAGLRSRIHAASLAARKRPDQILLSAAA